MSQSYDTTEAQYIRELNLANLLNWLLASTAVTLQIYEVAITFDQEVATVWMRDRKCSLGSILLVSTRWCMVFSAIFNLIPSPTMPESCKAITMIARSFAFIAFMQVAVFSALRASAIWGGNRVLFVAVLLLGTAPVVSNIYQSVFFVYSSEPGAPCPAGLDLSDEINTILVRVTRVALIVADIMVLVATWIRTYKQVVASRRIGTMTSISLCLLRDGTFYFIVLLVLNIIELLTHRTSSGSVISVLITTIPTILISRFMLNLRQIDTKNYTRTTNFSAPQFRAADSIFGNLGEPLEHGTSFHDEDAAVDELDEDPSSKVQEVREFQENGSFPSTRTIEVYRAHNASSPDGEGV